MIGVFRNLGDKWESFSKCQNPFKQNADVILYKRDLGFQTHFFVVRNLVVLSKNCDWSGKIEYLVIRVGDIQTYREIFRLLSRQRLFDR
jgi:hypothetical protein